jgi:tetratricopeptide (TPR) repeat protein
LWPVDFINYKVIKELLEGVFESDEELDNTLSELSDRAILMTKISEDGSYSYELHGMLADSLREQIDVSDDNYPIYKQYVIHRLQIQIDTPSVIDVCVYNSCFIWAEKKAPNSLAHKRGQVTALSMLAETLNDNKLAIDNYKKAIEIGKTLPKDDFDSQSVLGRIHLEFALFLNYKFPDYPSAIDNYNEAIKILEQLPKEKFKDEYYYLAWAHNAFAILMTDLNDYASAKENYDKAIDIWKLSSNDNSEHLDDLASTYNLLAILQNNHLNDYKSAKENYNNAIDIWKQLSNDNHKYLKDLASAHNRLAYLLKDHFKDYETAKENSNKAIEIAEQLSINNPEKYLIYVLGYKHSLADMYFANNELKPAKSILDEIKQPAEKCLADNPNDEWTKTVNNSINDLWEKINKQESEDTGNLDR